jgi:alpha-beta hydrolase superfamily lysophospholipase
VVTHKSSNISLAVESLAAHPQAGLIIVHGLAEYAGRYRDVAQVFASRGISCFAYDQRGHGANPEVRTHVERFDDFVADLRAIGRDLSAGNPGLPLFVWGHSMGSVVVTLLAMKSEPWLRGVITSSSSLEIFRNGLNPLNAFFRAAARIAPRIRIPLGLDGARISNDESVQHAYVNDPLIPHTASLRLIVEFAAACESCREHAAQITLPWLVTHGEADKIAAVEGSRVLFERLGSTDKKLVIYPGLRHEIHNEKPADRAAFLQLIGDWIAERSR